MRDEHTLGIDTDSIDESELNRINGVSDAEPYEPPSHALPSLGDVLHAVRDFSPSRRIARFGVGMFGVPLVPTQVVYLQGLHDERGVLSEVLKALALAFLEPRVLQDATYILSGDYIVVTTRQAVGVR